MSYTDWDFAEAFSGPGAGYTPDPSGLSPPAAGAARLNASVTPNPLTTTGAYCREYLVPPVGVAGFGVNNTGVVVGNINSSIASGRYVGPDNTRSYSFRSWVRLSTEMSSATYGMSVGVRVKAEDPVLVSGSGVWEGFNGYRLALTTSNPLTGAGYNGLRLCILTGTSGAGNGVVTECSGGPYVPDAWYRIRLDVIPVGSTQDNLEAYLFNPSTLSWTLVGTQTVLSSQIGVFAPWGDVTRRCGYYSSILSSGAGFFQNAKAWVDLFEAASEPV